MARPLHEDARVSRLHSWLIVLVLGVASAAMAEPEMPLRSYTLAEALSYARAHQPRIRAKLAELDARTKEVSAERWRWMPRGGAAAELLGATNNDSTAVSLSTDAVDLPRTGATGGRTIATTRWTPAASSVAALEVDQQVWDFGKTAALTAVADARRMDARADAALSMLAVQLGVEEAYHGVLSAKAVLHATQDAYDRAVTHRNYAQAGVKSGLRPPIDLTRAQADVALLDVRRIQAASGVEVSQAVLAAAMGESALAVDAAALTPDVDPAPTFDAVLADAAHKNPLIAAARAQLDAQRARTRVLTRSFLPNLWASLGIDGRAGGAKPTSGAVPYGDGWLPDVANWHLGVALDWTFFDGHVLGQARASRAREQAALAELDATRLDVSLAARRAWLDLQAALRVLPGLQASVSAARDNEAQADARFKAGLGNIVELADAENVRINAELALAIGQFTVARTRAVLAYAMGERPADAAFDRERP